MSCRTINGESELCQVMDNDLLLQTILDNLSARQLLLNKQVCHHWLDIIENLLKNRSSYETFLLIHYPKGFKKPATHSFSSKVQTKTKAFLDLISKSQSILESDNDSSMFQMLESYFSYKMRSFPDFAMIFSSSKTITEKFMKKNYLPPTCRTLYICARAGVIGKSSLTSKPLEIEKYPFKVNSITGCFMNKKWDDYRITLTDWNDEDSAEPDLNDDNYPVKCILIFALNFKENKRFVEFLGKTKPSVAIGGALVDGIWYKALEHELFTVTFSGKNIKSASLVLDTRTAKEAQNKLVHFKSILTFDPDDLSSNVKTLGFLFTCAGRGFGFYRYTINVESDLLHTIFPHVLFTGIFGNGEFGQDCHAEAEADRKVDREVWGDSKSHSYVNLHLSFTSVILLVQLSN